MQYDTHHPLIHDSPNDTHYPFIQTLTANSSNDTHYLFIHILIHNPNTILIILTLTLRFTQRDSPAMQPNPHPSKYSSSIHPTTPTTHSSKHHPFTQRYSPSTHPPFIQRHPAQSPKLIRRGVERPRCDPRVRCAEPRRR